MNLPDKYAKNPDLLWTDSLLAKNKFRDFIEIFWPCVSNDAFKPGYLVDVLAEYLQAFYVGEIKRLAIACPIRHGKTIISQVMFSGWMWLRNPQLRIIAATLSEKRAAEVSVDTRRLLLSDLYQAINSLKIEDDQNTKLHYRNQHGGFRMACGTGSGIGGASADVILVDDLIDYHKASSDAEREDAIKFYSHHLSKRLVPGTGLDRILVCGHRVHEFDTFAYIYQTFGNDGDWVYLVLPNEARPMVTNSFNTGLVIKDKQQSERWNLPIGSKWQDTRLEGEILAPERFNKEWVENEKRSLGHEYHTVYQQDPTPADGDFFSASWFRYCTESLGDGENPPTLYHLDRKDKGTKTVRQDASYRMATVDTAISTSTTACYTCCQIWDVIGEDQILVHQLRERLDGSKLVPTLASLYAKYRPARMIIEKQFVGQFVIDELRDRGVPVVEFDAKHHGKKEMRAVASQIRMQAGHVFWKKGQEGIDELEKELLAFPNGAFNDACDCLSMSCIEVEKYSFILKPLDGLSLPKHRYFGAAKLSHSSIA